jgi:hypothetical protein
LRGHEDNDTAGLDGGEGEKEVDRSIMPRKEVLEALTANVVAAVRPAAGDVPRSNLTLRGWRAGERGLMEEKRGRRDGGSEAEQMMTDYTQTRVVSENQPGVSDVRSSQHASGNRVPRKGADYYRYQGCTARTRGLGRERRA